MGDPTVGSGDISVVIIDDNSDIRALFADIVCNDGRFSLVASLPSADAALAYLRKATVDAVVLDNHVRDLTGYEAQPEIREAAPESCIVMWSLGGVTADSALQRGADLVLEKLVRPTQLLDQVVECVRAKQRAQRKG